MPQIDPQPSVGFPSNANKLRHVPAPLRNARTDDRGNEMTAHERLTQPLAIRIFFADSYRP